jgi:hypothetical protein
MSQTTLFAAVSPETAHISGAYLADCALGTPTLQMFNSTLSRELWDYSVELTKANALGLPV